MSFLYPAFLFGAVAIALPIVLHLLRRDQAPEVPFTAVRLLHRSPVDRSRTRRLRDALLLAARVIALLLLAAAFARPYVQGAAPARLRIVAVDRSYSMGGTTRFAAALERARAAIDEAAAGERVALVAFDERADVMTPPGSAIGSAADARGALARITPGFGATRYQALFDIVPDLAAGAPGRLIVVTDLQQSGWRAEDRPSLPAGWELDVRDTGAPGENVTIAGAAVEGDRLVASLHNSGSSERRGRVRVLMDTRDVAAADYVLPPATTSRVPIAWRPPAAGAITIAIDDASGLQADNTRHVVLGAANASKALVVASGDRPGLYVVRALETSAGEEGAIDVEVAAGPRLSAMTPDQLAGYPAIVVLSTRGIDQRGREAIAAHVRGGGGLFVAGSPDVEVDVLRAMAEWQPALEIAAQPDQRLTLAATDVRHPIFRPFGGLAANLGQVRFERAWRVLPDGWNVIARFTNGDAALVERSIGQGRVVLFASDLDRRWNDFPLHPGFVPFTIETIRYALGGRQGGREYTVADAPSGIGPAPGIYRSRSGQTVAVNVDPAEGMSRFVTSDGFAAMVQRRAPVAEAAGFAARQTEAHQGYWQYGLLVMIAALVAESFVGRS